MNTRKKFLSTLLMGAFATFLVTASAQEKVSTQLTDIRKEIGALENQIASATAALDGLKAAGKAKGDIKGAHANFDKSLKSLEKQIDTVRAQGLQIRANSDAVYKNWQSELSKMQNPKLRDKAQSRFDETKEEFDQIIVEAEEAKRELAPFMADLRDVSNYLKVDLSADAVKSLNSTVWRLGNKSSVVIASLKRVNAQISKTLEMSPEK